MTRFLEGFNVREVILGTIVFYIVALTINFGTLLMPHFSVFTNKIESHFDIARGTTIQSHFDIARGTTIQSIAAKVDSLINDPLLRDIDIQLACSKQLCTVSFSSEDNRSKARWAKKRFEASL